MEININSDLRQEVESRLLYASPDLFEKMEQQIRGTLQFDCLLRFAQSEQYKQYLLKSIHSNHNSSNFVCSNSILYSCFLSCVSCPWIYF
jgi:hypothetical protein